MSGSQASQADEQMQPGACILIPYPEDPTFWGAGAGQEVLSDDSEGMVSVSCQTQLVLVNGIYLN